MKKVMPKNGEFMSNFVIKACCRKKLSGSHILFINQFCTMLDIYVGEFFAHGAIKRKVIRIIV